MSNFRVGDEVLAPWLEDAFLYPAILVATDGVSMGHVAYLDGEEADVPLSGIRHGVLGPGLAVSVNWKGKAVYYGGTIVSRTASALYIAYEDGTQGWATIAQCRVLKAVMAMQPAAGSACRYCGGRVPEGQPRCPNCGATAPVERLG